MTEGVWWKSFTHLIALFLIHVNEACGYAQHQHQHHHIGIKRRFRAVLFTLLISYYPVFHTELGYIWSGLGISEFF